MGINVKQIQDFFESWAPTDLAANWDNIGLQIGDPNAEINELIIALEVDEHVLNELKSKTNCLVITHHPLFFKPLSNIRYDHDMGDIIQTFSIGSHHLFSAHTNLDAAVGGVNDCFIKLYGLNPKKGTSIDAGFGKYFDSPNISLDDLLQKFPGKSIGSNQTSSIKRLGFCAGSGHGLMKQVLELNIDTFVTGEVNYHDEVFARMNNIRLIVVGHKESEDCIKDEIKLRLKKQNLDIPIKII